MLPLSGLALHHVAVVVTDLAAAVERYRALGFRPGHAHIIPEQAIEAVVISAGPGFVELISPLDSDGPISRFLAKRGEGIHHVAYRVDDLDAALATLAAQDIRLIDRNARTGMHGWRIAFIHPDACAGVLTELVEVTVKPA